MTDSNFEQILKSFSLTPTDVMIIPIAALLFVVLWKTLESVLFLPFLKLLEAREQATIGNEAQAVADLNQVEELQRSYEQQLQEIRIRALEQKYRSLESTKQEVEKLAASEEAALLESSSRLRSDLDVASKNARAALVSDAQELADQIVSKVLSGSTSTATQSSTQTRN
jgi:F0F1-type ATP synthase membrane subunit b/b'